MIAGANQSQIATMLNGDIRVFDAVTGHTLHTVGSLQLRFGLCELANGMLAFLEQDMSKQFRLCLWRPGTVDITKTAVYLPPTTLSLQMLSAGDDMLITSDFAGTNHLIDVQHQIFKLLHCPSQDSHLLCNDCAKIGEMVAFVESSQDIHFYQ